jgi:hypothetical protein
VVDQLSGLNVTYKRTALMPFKADFEQGLFEAFLHQEFQKQGHQLYFSANVVVYHHQRYQFSEVIIQFYHHARAFAAMRLMNASGSKRLIFAGGTWVLPMVLTLRVLHRVIRKKRRFREMALSLPYLVVLMLSWAWGELCGYAFGIGNSARKWR